MRARLSRRLFLAAFACALAPRARAGEQTLRLAFIPQENPEKLLDDIAAIAGWLAEEIGASVEGFATIDHTAAVEALRNGDADISFMGALPFVLAEAEIGAAPLLSEVYRGETHYRGRIFARRGGGIRSLADLKGRDIAFADPISESGYLYPLAEFERAGLIAGPEDAERFFGRVFFAGGYQQAMQAVAEGLVDAAGASQYADLLLTPEQRSQVVWIAESPPIPSHAVIARAGLDPDLSARFVAAMLKLNAPEHRATLRRFYGADGYRRADPAAFDGVRKLARRYGFLK